jgi:hypothetical protein
LPIQKSYTEFIKPFNPFSTPSNILGGGGKEEEIMQFFLFATKLIKHSFMQALFRRLFLI